MSYIKQIIDDLKNKNCEVYLPIFDNEFDILVWFKNKPIKISLKENENTDVVVTYESGVIKYSFNFFEESVARSGLNHFDPKIKVIGPYTNTENRLYVRCIDITTNKGKNSLYSRYLMEQKLKRYLTEDETVDHIDRDKNNDSIDNLQILSFKEHIKLDCKRIKLKEIELICIWCNKVFLRKVKREIYSGEHSGPFCSGKCIGEYGSRVQKNEIVKFENQPKKILDKSEREYYYLPK